MNEHTRDLAGRTQSADAAVHLGRIQESGRHQHHPAFQQGSLVCVPAGSYFTNQSSRSTIRPSVDLFEASRGRVISVAVSRSNSRRQGARASLVDPREYISAEGCMCFRVLLTDGLLPHVDFIFVPEAMLAPWRDCICLAYASWPCPRCHQVSYCSQHCQQKHWEVHQHDCMAPRATLRPAHHAAVYRSHLAPLPSTYPRGRHDSAGCCDPFVPLSRPGRLSQSQQNLAEDLLPPAYAVHSTSIGFEQIPEEAEPSPRSKAKAPSRPFWKFWLKRKP